MIYAKKAKQEDVGKDKGEQNKEQLGNDKVEGDKSAKTKKGGSSCGC
ncbi:MAG TPA: hypothetical protein VGP47_04315 [Parachlamydiaceae bacterium]|nr:hypothetical protein [Parachlamydiaceae bacterium]